MLQNEEFKALVDAAINSNETANQIDTAEQEKFKQQQEDILNRIAEYLVEYLKPLSKVEHLLSDIYYTLPPSDLNVGLYFNKKTFVKENNTFQKCIYFQVKNKYDCIRIFYLYDSNEIKIDVINDDNNNLFDEFLIYWNSTKNKINESIEYQLRKIEEDSLIKIKANQARAHLYNNFKV